MEEGRTLPEITAELESKVTAIIKSQPPKVQPKKSLLSWTQKKSYTDTALEAVNKLCTQILPIVDSYNKSSSKLTFAAANAVTLMSMKSNLDALDPKTWTPKVVDEDTKRLAQALGDFAHAILLSNETALGFLQKSTPEQLQYELVNKFPPQLSPATIYLRNTVNQKDKTIDFCYISESNPSQIITGKIPEMRLGGHKTEFSNQVYFDANKRESQNKKNAAKSIGEMLYVDTLYYLHSPRTAAIQLLDSMHTATQQSIAEYDKGKTQEKSPRFGK